MRESKHVSLEDMDRFLQGGVLTPSERRSVIRHLLSRCELCLGALRGGLSVRPAEPDLTGLVRRLDLSSLLARYTVETERAEAAGLWTTLRTLAPAQRLLAVKNDPALQTWGLFEAVLGQARSVARNDPVHAVDLAHLALTIAELLDPQMYGGAAAHDYRVQAHTCLGNTKRLVGDFRGAQESLSSAEALLPEGSGDPLDKASLLSIRASLLTDLGSPEEATDLLEAAIRCARHIRDRHLEGRCRIQQSSSIGWIDPVRGLALAEEGLSLIDLDRDPHLELCGRHLLALWSNETGDPAEAQSIVATYRYLYAQFTDVFWTGRLLHLGGSIARMEGHLYESEILFRQLIDLYAEHEHRFDLALAALDLAEVLSLQGKTTESEEILAHFYPILEAWRLHADILRSWSILRDGVCRREIQKEGFRELALTLRRTWHRRDR
jgi:tetratricopeptide (TPR) repeat protein